MTNSFIDGKVRVMFNLTVRKALQPKKRALKKQKEEMVASQVKNIMSSNSQNLIVAVKN